MKTILIKDSKINLEHLKWQMKQLAKLGYKVELIVITN